jgi:DNA-binding FadR family transcriptional regulator
MAEYQRLGLGPGSRLPTERQLALDLGVTRSAIRHAMAMLEAQGFVSREVGRGTFLRIAGLPAADSDLGDPGDFADFAPADVMMVRRLLEPQVLPLVVAWATAADFAEMERCLDGGDNAADHEEFELWDTAVHRAIFAASHSALLIQLYRDVETARHGRAWGDLKLRSSSAERRAHYQREHREIVTALRMRDADRAAVAMRAHLAHVSRNLLGTE